MTNPSALRREAAALLAEADLGFTITIKHGHTTVTSLLGEEDIYGVVEAIFYALLGIGFLPESVRDGFGAYA